MSFNHSKNYGLPPRRSWFNLRKPAAEVDRVFAVSGGATLVSSHGVSCETFQESGLTLCLLIVCIT